jgi:PTS system nitrogen regulatory IIA component
VAQTLKRLERIMKPGHVAYDVQASSKKRALEMLGDLLARDEPQLTPAEIFESLLARERLGGTGLGKGVAIPHGRVKGGGAPVAGFMRLKHPVDFDALDKEPVDLLFALVVPDGNNEVNEEYLQVLAELAEMLSEEAFRDKLRHAQSQQELFETITGWGPPES